MLTPGVAKTLAPVPSRVRALPDLGLGRSAPVTLAPPAAQSRHGPREHQPTRPNSPNDIYSPLRVVVLHSSSPAPWRATPSWLPPIGAMNPAISHARAGLGPVDSFISLCWCHLLFGLVPPHRVAQHIMCHPILELALWHTKTSKTCYMLHVKCCMLQVSC